MFEGALRSCTGEKGHVKSPQKPHRKATSTNKTYLRHRSRRGPRRRPRKRSWRSTTARRTRAPAKGGRGRRRLNEQFEKGRKEEEERKTKTTYLVAELQVAVHEVNVNEEEEDERRRPHVEPREVERRVGLGIRENLNLVTNRVVLVSIWRSETKGEEREKGCHRQARRQSKRTWLASSSSIMA